VDNDKRLGILRAPDRVSEHQGGVYAQQGLHASSIDRKIVVHFLAERSHPVFG
jgi:hypothetical protein